MDLHVKTIQRHERDFARQTLIVHLLEDLRSKLIGFHDMMKQSVAGSHLDSHIYALVAIEILDHRAVVAFYLVRHVWTFTGENDQCTIDQLLARGFRLI